jgi:hypothetical protein
MNKSFEYDISSSATLNRNHMRQLKTEKPSWGFDGSEPRFAVRDRVLKQ